MKAAAVVLLVTLAACSPKAYAPTVLVTNETCNAGQCRSLQILAFDASSQYQSAPPFPGVSGWGFPLGDVTSASACLTFPHSTPLTLNGQTLATLTVADPFTLIARDTLTLIEAPRTGTFVPQDAQGWSVTLDTAPVGPGTPIAMDKACTP